MKFRGFRSFALALASLFSLAATGHASPCNELGYGPLTRSLSAALASDGALDHTFRLPEAIINHFASRYGTIDAGLWVVDVLNREMGLNGIVVDQLGRGELAYDAGIEYFWSSLLNSLRETPQGARALATLLNMELLTGHASSLTDPQLIGLGDMLKARLPAVSREGVGLFELVRTSSEESILHGSGVDRSIPQSVRRASEDSPLADRISALNIASLSPRAPNPRERGALLVLAAQLARMTSNKPAYARNLVDEALSYMTRAGIDSEGSRISFMEPGGYDGLPTPESVLAEMGYWNSLTFWHGVMFSAGYKGLPMLGAVLKSIPGPDTLPVDTKGAIGTILDGLLTGTKK